MKLNWVERWVVNNPLRVLEQRLEIRWLKKMHALEPGFAALEIGCGRGAGAGLLLKEFQPSRIHALDLDLQMLRKAEGYLSSEEKQKISLITGDACWLPLESASVTAVFDFGALHHAVDWRSALSEISRVLKPGGAFFMEELYPALYQNVLTKHILLHPREDRFFSADLRRALTDLGLPLTKVIELKWVGILGVAVKA
jgi:ubiquinone/menaquinone biosynthesis C-methylase UbiE